MHRERVWPVLTELGSPVVLLLGAFCLALVARQRRRAFSCSAGPLVAAVIAEVVRHAVGRLYTGVPTFPSGTVLVVAALLTGAALAARGPLRAVIVAVGTACCVLVAMAVVVLALALPHRRHSRRAPRDGRGAATGCGARRSRRLTGPSPSVESHEGP